MGAGHALAEKHSDDHHGAGSDDHHGTSHYVKIWAVLLGLLVVSLIGPMIGVRWLTIVTAFGIAIIKALMVCAYFMHLNIEKRYIWYLLYTMLLMVALFFWGVHTDINHHVGSNWINASAEKLIEDNQNWRSQTEHGGGEHGSTPAASEPAPEHK